MTKDLGIDIICLMLGILGKLLDSNDREINKLKPQVARINDLEPKIAKLTDVALRGKFA